MGKRTNTAVWLDNQNRWQIKVQKDGERKTFTSSKPGRTGQREANAKADAWLDDNIVSSNVKVQTVYEDWIKELKITTSQGNWQPLKYRWEGKIKPIIGSKKVSSLTEQHLQMVINQALQDGLSKKSLQNLAADLRAFCKYCRKTKVSTLFPENIKIPSIATSKPKRILQPHDIKKLFSIDTTLFKDKVVFDKYIYAYRFQVVTGLRPGELAGLRWEDVNDPTIEIHRSINKYNIETTGKNENANRSFAIGTIGQEILNQQKEVSQSERVFEITTLDGYRKRWKRYCETNGISNTSPYELRHTFISVVKTLPIGQVKDIVGHSKDMDTFGVYGHELLGEKEQTAQDVNALFEKLLQRNGFENGLQKK